MANDNLTTKQPTKFIGLHGHSTASSGDAIGFANEHIDYALKNGMDGLALTDHGNMNGISFQQLRQQELTKKGVKFKAIPGIEAYFIPSLKDWSVVREQRQEEKQAAKLLKQQLENKPEDNIGDELADTKKQLDEELTQTVQENEEESKSNKYNDPINARSHLVVLPKSNKGLKNLFKLVSQSYKHGFYKYPRIDLEMIREIGQGELIGLSACVGGNLAKIVFDHQDTSVDWKDWKPNNHRFEEIQTALKLRAEQFVESFGGLENYYAEIQLNKLGVQHLVNQHLIELSKRTGIKLVVTVDSHYSDPNHWREREIYKAMAWASKTKGQVTLESLPQTIDELKCELYPKNAEQIWKTYKETTKEYDFYDDSLVCEAIERTYDIAHDLINNDITVDSSVKLPALTKLIDKHLVEQFRESIGPGATDDDIAFKELVRVSLEGLRRRGKYSDIVYATRLKQELEDIKYLQDNYSQYKLAKYFLTEKKIIDVTSEELLIGNGRGSVAGSLIAYCLDITQVDPIKWGTVWERFISRKKASNPDIDQDWSDRDKAVKMIAEYFGGENVIPITNISQLQLRSLVKDVARLHGLPFEEINKQTSLIEQEALSERKKEAGFDRQVWVLTYEEAEKHSPTFRKLMEEHPEFKQTLQILFKQIRGLSRHAGGVVVTENAEESMPLITVGGELQTPWTEGLNYRHLEPFGFIKFDVLGLGTLRIFENTIRKILIKQGTKRPKFKEIRDWFINNLHPDNNAMEDPKVFKNIFWDGRYAGIFQFVNSKTQDFMKQMKPKNVKDIAIATSIFRPGPLGLGVDKQFLQNRANPSKIVYQHPLLKDVYKETSGLLIFQEQLMYIYNKLAGVPLEDTDKVRKAFTKKDISNTVKAQQDRDNLRVDFTKKCKEVNNIPESVSGDIFDNMEKLVSYSFNLAHAVSYAITTYQCAWLLNYYPDEWITSYLDYCTNDKGTATGKEDPKATALREALVLGYKIGKPDINKSDFDFVLEDKTLVPSAASLKYVGKMALAEIKEHRPYTKVEDLLVIGTNTWKHSKFNKRSLDTLIKLEALDSMDLVGTEPHHLFRHYKDMQKVVVGGYEELKRASMRKKNNNVSELLRQKIEEVKQQNNPDWTDEEKMEFGSELAGSFSFNLVITPEAKDKLYSMGFMSIDEYEAKGKYWAAVKQCIIKTTKTGRPYLFLKLFGESGQIYQCYCWNYSEKQGVELPKENDIVVLPLEQSDMGFKSFAGSLYIAEKHKLGNY
jgi:DNA polymerase-3 subunit alpha